MKGKSRIEQKNSDVITLMRKKQKQHDARKKGRSVANEHARSTIYLGLLFVRFLSSNTINVANIIPELGILQILSSQLRETTNGKWR